MLLKMCDLGSILSESEGWIILPPLEEEESKEIEIEMKRTSKRIKGLIQEEDVQ